MDVALVESLRERYPQVFGELTRTEAGDGWYSLLDRLGAELSSGPGPYSSIRLFKEKVGELRFGKVSVRPEHRHLLDRFTEQSRSVCEICGAKGAMQPRATRVRCPEHAQVEHADSPVSTQRR
jgi:hypothetical protein